MKTIYFVRHGESEGNTSSVFMDDTAPLTEQGRQQAAAVADRCVRLPIETIISSTMPRAMETAAIINGKIDKPIAYCDLFVERRRPSEFLGKDKESPEIVAMQKMMRSNFGYVSDYRFSDEENFTEIKMRALAALDYLAGRDEERILVVTHGWFMHMMVACAVCGSEITDKECMKFANAFMTKNTGVTVFKHEEREEGSLWRILVWNDHAHLG
ncbi:MAG: histidine phosphatase family protein [Candidatus Pacebacteria bacterium]|nr:histidine phosphatase family protein [Candidatus Paceibacterota bacterium]